MPDTPRTPFRDRQVKIVATLGPASSSPEKVAELFRAGVDVFRMNFSHGTHEEHEARYRAIRQVEAEHGRPIAVMADLQGPKLRIGTFKDGEIALKPGDSLRLDLDDTPGDRTRVQLPHPEIFDAIDAGHTLLLDDGRVRLEVEACGPGFAETRVVDGTKLSDRKGVNVPNAILDLSALTDKDRADMAFALDLGVDWVALSFVQRPEDVANARKLVDGRAAVLVKVEKPSAIYHIEDLIMLADAVMVARGDLGVEMPVEKVPGLQKQIIRHSRRAGKPVIVATQMLESMVSAPTPTRAEASDVATAVFDGADAIMLSAETAAGDYPVEAVATMDRIARSVERDPLFRAIIDAETYDPEATAADAITAAARQVARTIGAAAIVTYTTSGSTTLRAARERPEVPILCLTEVERTARRLALSWGVRTVLTQDVDNFADMVMRAVSTAKEMQLADAGQRLVITAGVPFGTPGTTNVLRLAWVD
jgi:pyruvate kinase